MGRLVFLVDTNVWLEVLLDQDRADEASALLKGVDGPDLAMTDFSLFSIGIILTRLDRDDVFRAFVGDAFEQAGVRLVRLGTLDLGALLDAHNDFGLDFDDAYQATAAARHDLTLVSFDDDLDRTDRGRKEPARALADVGGPGP